MQRIIRPLSQEFLYASPEALDRNSYRAQPVSTTRQRRNDSLPPHSHRGRHEPGTSR